MALTPEQIAKLQAIIRDASTAVAIKTTGLQVTEGERKRLEAEGYLGGDDFDFVLDGFNLGRLDPEKDLTYAQMQRELRKNPMPLSKAEKAAVEVAQRRAGMYCVGLGNRYSSELGQVVVDADAELAQRTRQAIRDGVSTSIAKRETVKQLKTRLGQMTQDWARDWDRIAATEMQMAHQEGFLAQHDDEDLLAKIPEPDACEHCKKHYLEADGKPKVRPRSWWEAQGTSNAGRKQADWKPVLGAMHPWCRCQLVTVPAGWGFDEAGDLVPLEDEVEKAHKLDGRMKFQGFNISIENAKGGVRHWTDRTGKKGTTKFRYPYGYIRQTEGVDGDHVDVFVGPNEDAKNVYVIHQMAPPRFDSYDEDKCMLGFDSAAAAKKAYLQHYDNPKFFGTMTTMPVETFRKKVYALRRKMIKSLEQEIDPRQLTFDFADVPMPQVPEGDGTDGAFEITGVTDERQVVVKAEPVDQLDLWKSAVTKAGLKPEDFHLIVKYARQGHAQARAKLDEVQTLVKALRGSSEAQVGTMGNHSQPARTAAEVNREAPKDLSEAYPNRTKKDRKKRDLEDPKDKYDVVGLKQDGGWDRKPEIDQLTTKKQPRKVRENEEISARESAEEQQQVRAERRGSSQISYLEIYP